MGKKTPQTLRNVPLWKDILMVSRPGWWLVSLWLYLAPTKYEVVQNLLLHDTAVSTTEATATRQEKALVFLAGLLYVCLPLNLLTYALNDFADVDMDQSNDRKGNYMFGSKGIDRTRLKIVIEIALATTFLPIPWFAKVISNNSSMHDVFSREEAGQEQDFERHLLLLLGIWYVAVLLVNVSYNFSILGHLSGSGPWETPLVYIGFGLVTVFSYLINVFPFQQDDRRSGIFGCWQDETFYLFGCNPYYWIHLAFLITTTQLWTEYMDYQVDLQHKRQTTLTRFFSSKKIAKRFIVVVMALQVVWASYMVLFVSYNWKLIMLYSVASIVDTGPSKEPRKEGQIGSSLSDSSHWHRVAVGQNIGGLFLLSQVWANGLFVA